MKKIQGRIIFRITGTAFFFFLFSLFSSCRTVPQMSNAVLETTNFAPLNSGGLVYIFANAKQALPVISQLPFVELDDRQTRQMLDRTEYFMAVLFPPESSQLFQLAAWGNYPGFWGKIGLAFNRRWKKQQLKTGESFWYSRENGLSLMMDSRQAFVVSSIENTPTEPVPRAPGAEIPEGFGEFSRSAILSCWFENPAPLLNSFLDSGGIPIRIPAQKLFLNLSYAQPGNPNGQYEALIRLRFENASLARGAASLFALAAGYSADDPNSIMSVFFFANPPVQNGNNLDIKTAPLNDGDIALLLEMFSL